MASLRTIELVLCAAALATFGWGVVRFFQKPSGHTRSTSLVAGFGLGFAGWHLWAIGVAATAWWRGLVAIGLYTVAIVLFIWAVRSFRRRRPTAIFETDVPRNLVRDGPYRYIRHPFYTAYILFWIAGWLASNSWVALVSVIVMSATYVQAATKEEAKFRTSPLAADHAEYCRRTGFMIPGPWLLRGDR